MLVSGATFLTADRLERIADARRRRSWADADLAARDAAATWKEVMADRRREEREAEREEGDG